MDWNDTRDQLLANVGKLHELSPDTVAGYLTASGAGRKTARLDEKTRQLIALAVAVTTRCDGCISVHSNEAMKAGASREELAEALGVEQDRAMEIIALLDDAPRTCAQIAEALDMMPADVRRVTDRLWERKLLQATFATDAATTPAARLA